jgi:hypothetical protein
MAQGPERQPMPVEERVKRTMERLKPELELTEQQEKDMTPVYTTFYTEMDKLRSGGERPTPEARQKVTDARDEQLKKILNEAQMKKLKEIEEQMRQRRPGIGQAA